MKIAIIGRSEILFNTLLKLKNAGHEITCIITAKEAPEYTKTSEDFREIAKELNIPFAMGAKIANNTELLTLTKSDIAVSLNFSGIIPQTTIDLFPLGILNAHGGDLPKYRGNACQAWAILNGEEKVGLCIHKMIGDELDSGDIIAREFLKIDINTKITEVWKWMVERVPNLFLKSISKITNDSSFIIEKQSKEEKNISRCFPLNPSDGKINWSNTSSEILRQINAHNKPYSGAYSHIRDKKVIVWDAELVDINQTYYAIPGQVIKIEKGSVQISCGKGQIKIYQVEINGNMINPDEYIQSIRTRFK